MFSRNRTDAAPDETPEQAERVPGKGRPTPTRREAEAARRRPLVPTDRKAAAKSQREALKEQRNREYQAMQTGDERYLPAQHSGPVRRWVRDYVDARWNIGEFFLPVSLVMVVAMLVTGQNVQVGLVVLVVLYVFVLLTIVDGLILGRILKKRLRERFGDVPRGSVMYGVVRAFQIRRTRLPRPQVARGRYPA